MPVALPHFRGWLRYAGRDLCTAKANLTQN
jgi:hypothetical protein